jgi:(E)-4-hydroxy-3-methylbut-2-enyl-diphosphate synthase
MTAQLAPALTSEQLPYCPDPLAYRRRRTRVVMVGDIGVGGTHPIRVQSMTTTRTQDVESTVAQVERLVRAGCEIVRITAPTVQDARVLGDIRRELQARGVLVPLVADIHFSPAAALEAAEHVEKVRVNPGNYADSRTFAVREYTDAEYERELDRIEERFAPLVLKCKSLGVAMRIGTNHGSLSDRIMNRFGDTPLGMVESALEFLRICERNDYRDVILSMKASNPKVMIQAYRLLVARMDQSGMDYPLHLGVTEAGNDEDGRIKSAVGIGSLLDDGLGDTIRVSLTEEPEAEIPVAQRLAAPYNDRAPQEYASPSALRAPMAGVRDPYSYTRRPSVVSRSGPFTIAVDLATGNRPGAPAPDLVIRPVLDESDLSALGRLAIELSTSAPEVAVGARLGPETREPERCVEHAHLVQWVADGDDPPPSALLEAAQARKRVLLLESRVDERDVSAGVDRVIGWARLAIERGVAAPMLALRAPDASTTIRAYRLLAAKLDLAGPRCPLHLVAPIEANPYERLLRTSVALGSLLSDGIGDSVEVRGGEDPAAVRLAFNVLQAAGARITKTEFVACPSCGRTLFDLQPTTDRIKLRTGHLKGVKIAIMGCIVNGPGEMADADFGYVGGAPGKVNLYVGKECVERNVPQAEADDRLIELIRAHGGWTEEPA